MDKTFLHHVYIKDESLIFKIFSNWGIKTQMKASKLKTILQEMFEKEKDFKKKRNFNSLWWECWWWLYQSCVRYFRSCWLNNCKDEATKQSKNVYQMKWNDFQS